MPTTHPMLDKALLAIDMPKDCALSRTPWMI
jgi:hypothetical protein